MKTIKFSAVAFVLVFLSACNNGGSDSPNPGNAEKTVAQQPMKVGDVEVPKGTTYWKAGNNAYQIQLPDGVYLLGAGPADNPVVLSSFLYKCTCKDGVSGGCDVVVRGNYLACAQEQGACLAGCLGQQTPGVEEPYSIGGAMVVDVRLGVHFASDDEVASLKRSAPAGLLALPQFRADLLKMMQQLEEKSAQSYEELEQAYSCMYQQKERFVQVPISVYGYLATMDVQADLAELATGRSQLPRHKDGGPKYSCKCLSGPVGCTFDTAVAGSVKICKAGSCNSCEMKVSQEQETE